VESQPRREGRDNAFQKWCFLPVCGTGHHAAYASGAILSAICTKAIDQVSSDSVFFNSIEKNPPKTAGYRSGSLFATLFITVLHITCSA